MTLLNLHRLSISFGEKEVVSDVDLTVNAGEVVALVGESGCGKTMTALSIGQILPPEATWSAEALDFEDRDLRHMDTEELRRLRGNRFAYIFQEPMTSLNPVLRVGRQLTEVLEAHGHREKTSNEEKALRLLSEVQFEDPDRIYTAYPHQLSGGMRQRVMIAMALLLDPALLIADEPTTALDVTVQQEIMLLLADLRKRHNMAMLLISHDLDLVGSVADRTVVMYAGQVVETGTTGTLLDSPRHPYTQGLLLSTPAFQKSREELHFISGNVENAPRQGCRFAPRCPLAEEACTRSQTLNDGVRCHKPLDCIQADIWKHHA